MTSPPAAVYQRKLSLRQGLKSLQLEFSLQPVRLAAQPIGRIKLNKEKKVKETNRLKRAASPLDHKERNRTC
eukprot:1149224-Pelagomonas_calceolata.AAC.4